MLYIDILRQANLHRGQVIDASLGNWYINEGMQALAVEHDTACKRDYATLVCTGGVWTALPSGCIRVTEAVIGGTYVPYDDYETSFNELRTMSTVDLDITYLTVCDPVVGATGTPAVHSLYHMALALFMAARDRQRVMADEDGDSLRLMAEFYDMAGKANARLASVKGTRRIMKVGVFR